MVENLNSRLRNYFFSAAQGLSDGYVNLLQFFLNHRQFMRSIRPERVGKSPKELLTGKLHPHWLELLGFKDPESIETGAISELGRLDDGLFCAENITLNWAFLNQATVLYLFATP